MSKIKRLTSLYEALATMRRENLQTTFDLVELIHKINDETHIDNPEPSYDTSDNIDLPIGVRLKWALIALGRTERELRELKQENQNLKITLNKSQNKIDRLKEKCRSKGLVISCIKEKKLRLEAKHFKQTIDTMRDYTKSLQIRINYLTTQIEKFQSNPQQETS